MDVIFILIGISVCVALGFLIAFIRAEKTGQFDDVETPAMRMLFDDVKPESNQPQHAD